jgi:membrane protease YdiL (CAAX protease family)
MSLLDDHDKQSAPIGDAAGSSHTPPQVFLRLPAAILLVIGCLLLQAPIHLAARTIMGKNLSVAAALLLGMFLPATALILWFSPRPKETLRLRTIPLAGTILVTGASLSFASLASGTVELLLRSGHIPERLIELLEQEEVLFREVFRLQDSLDVIIVAVVLIIITPLAEELLFRGILQGSLERAIGHWPGLLIAGLAFGALHGRIRFIPVSLLGLLIGYVVMRTNSLPAGILAHAINNLVILGLNQIFWWRPSSWNLPLLTALLGGIGLAVVLPQFRTLTEDDPKIPRKAEPLPHPPASHSGTNSVSPSEM